MIVVGIDGSPGSQPALRFAADEARLRGVKLRVVIAAQIPTAIYFASSALAAFDPDATRRTARDLAELDVETVVGPRRSQNVEVTALAGGAASVLIEESRRAQLLVVGSRGHGGFAGLLLGSVGQHCAAHAHCPVVIVHPPRAK